MTIYYYDSRIINTSSFPKWNLSTAIQEPYKNGWEHLKVSYSNQFEGQALGATQRISIFISGCALFCPVINVMTYSTLRHLSQSKRKQALSEKKKLIQEIKNLTNKVKTGLLKITDAEIRKEQQTEVNFLKNKSLDVLKHQKKIPACGLVVAQFKQMMMIKIKLIESFLAQQDVYIWQKNVYNQVIHAKGNHANQILERAFKEGHDKKILDKKMHRFVNFFESNIFITLASANKIALLAPIMKFDINLSASTLRGNTGLIWAVANANNELAMKMITLAKEHRFINAQCIKGNTALHLAVGKGYKYKSKDNQKLAFTNLTLAKTLLNHGGNPNLQNNTGSSPLHLACLRRDPDFISTLLKKGGDPSIKNLDGNTPQDLLMNDYRTSSNILKQMVFVYLLDKEEHRNNLAICQTIFSNFSKQIAKR